ncbi:MAG: RsmB/NOP family class I SAM-dependent RNA methyltransferase [Micropepsaceae bacterium]
MRPDARVSAAIEVVRLVLAGSAADRALVTWGKANRFAGSGDRRAIGDIVFAALRSGDTSRDPRAMVIAGLSKTHDSAGLESLFSGGRHAPPPLTQTERAALDLPADTLPAFLAASLERAFGGAASAEIAALQGRAPLDLRVNTLKATRDQALEKLSEDGIIAEPVPFIDTALRVLAGGVDVEGSEAHRLGLVEIQDAGSQVAAAALEAQPGETVLDLCAGAGGKTLALAAAMHNTGRILACDTGAVRLKHLPGRAQRAGVSIIETKLLAEDWLDQPSPFTGPFDRILIDAPCSGSGTWRRNPETRARLTPIRMAGLTALQVYLLAAAAPLVRPGGRITYVTCSILPDEDEDIAETFLSAHPDFAPAGPMRRLSPHSTGTDGFFIASFRRTR